MACKNCKDTPKFTEEEEKEFGRTPRWVIWTTVIMVILSTIGIYNVISFMINLFL
jgi:hypothetical protein